MKRGFLLLALPVFTQSALPAETNTVYSFLRADVSSRASGMAGSFVGILNDPDVIFYNPAGMSTLERPMGSVGFFKHLLDINTGYLAYSQEIQGVGYVGAGVMYTNYGSFEQTDVAGNNLGTFNAGDLAGMIGYSNLLDEHLHYGISLKFIHSSIAGYTSTGIAFDAGLLYNIPESRLTLGMSVLNAGTQLTSYGSVEEELPLDVVVGGSVVPRGLPLLLHLSFHKLNADTKSFGDRFKVFKVGGEFTLSSSFLLRVGYDNEKRTDLKIGTSSGLAGFSGGLGVRVSDYRVDYALSSLGKVGELHRITIGIAL